MIASSTRREFLACAAVATARAEGSRLELAGISFDKIVNGESNRRYLRIHASETTAGEALVEHMKIYRGVAYLVAGHERNVNVAGGWLDPNRMFSRAGAERSYRALNPAWGDAEVARALDWLDRERPRLLEALLPPEGGLLFALHNNSGGYSMEDELPLCRRTSLPNRRETHDFFLTTAERDFQRLAAGPYNVLFEDDPGGEDDGSLSRLCARRGVRYVNLETALGKLAGQREMMRWLERSLPR